MTNCEPINCPIPKSLRTGRRSNGTNASTRQSGVEGLSGYSLQASLEFPPSVSDAFTMFNPLGAKI